MTRFLLLIALLCSASAARAASDPLPAPGRIEVVPLYEELEVDMIDRDNRRIPLMMLDPDTSSGVVVALGQAAVKSVMLRNGEKRLAALRLLLADFGFQQRFERALTAKLAAAELVAPANVQWMRTPAEFAAARGTEGTGVLVLTPRHTVLSTFEDLAVVVEARRVDRRNKNGKVKEKILEQRAYAHYFLLDKIDGSFASEDARRWEGLGGERLTAMLDKAIDEVTDMIAYDLTAAGQAEAQTKVKLSDRKSFMIGGMARFGRPLEPAPGRMWLRKNDRLESFAEVDAPAAEPAE